MAGYVPTGPSVRFGTSFQGNRRDVRRLVVTCLLLLLALGAAGASARTLVPSEAELGLVPEGCRTVRPLPSDPSRFPRLPAVERDRDAANVELDREVRIGPPLFDVQLPLAAGDAFQCTLTIRSRQPEPATFELTPLGVVGSRAPRAGYEFVDRSDPRWQQTAGPWIEPAAQVITMPPRGVARVPFRVAVPENPPVGSAYGALGVTLRTREDAGGTSIGVESVVASVLLLRVGGEGQPQLELRGVDAPRLRWSREPWPIEATLDNDGTLHARTDGRVRVRSIFGNEVATLPLPSRVVFPGGREQLDAEWDGVPWFGFYRWDMRVANDGLPTSVAIADGWFFALPPWWVLALAGLVMLVLLVRFLRRRADRWGEEADAEDHHDDPDGFDFDLAERQLRR